MPTSFITSRFQINEIKGVTQPITWDIFSFDATANYRANLDALSLLRHVSPGFYDASKELGFPQFSFRFDVHSASRTLSPGRFDAFSETTPCSHRGCSRCDINTLVREKSYNRFDAVSDQTLRGAAQYSNQYDAKFITHVFSVGRLDAISVVSIPCNALVSNRFDSRLPPSLVFQCGRFEAINTTRPESPFFTACGRFDVSLGKLAQGKARFDSINDFFNADRRTGRFDSCVYLHCSEFLSSRFDAFLPNPEAKSSGIFHAIRGYPTKYSSIRQAFVNPGWRFLAKNIATNEILDLGFINADSEHKFLENIVLPDGDYEISVLTSSLFWKDTIDHNIRLISIRPGEEVSPLPTIYNLRSTVSEGQTTIFWSASRSEVEDCVFGVWYSSSTPVSTDRPPDAVVWYSPEFTEYQTSFQQTALAYVAVAAMRTGNEPEIGPVKELFLDWKTAKPRCPDDVVILDKPLPIFDPNILTIQDDNPDLTLWA